MTSFVQQKSNNPLCRTYRDSLNWFQKLCECEIGLLGFDKTPIRTLLIGNISKKTKPSDLNELLSRYGEIQKFEVIGKRRRLEVYVTFYNEENVLRAKVDSVKMRMVLHNRILELFPGHGRDPPKSIANCPSVEVYSSTKSGRTNDTRIETLNDIFLTKIFLYLPILDRIRIERVCKRWQVVSQASWTHVRKLVLLQYTWGHSYGFHFKEINSPMLRNVLRRCGSHLEELHVSFILDMAYTTLLSDTAEFCPNLKVINVINTPVAADSIASLAGKCRELRCLSLNMLDGPCDSGLTRVFAHSPKLNYFRGCHHFRGNCLLHLSPTTLREIVLTYCDGVVLDNLAQALPKLKNLSTLEMYNKRFGGKLDLPAEVMRALNKNCKYLSRLKLVDFSLGVATSKWLVVELSNLEVLILQRTDIDDGFLIRLSTKCQRIIHLDISDNPAITWAGIEALASLPKLGKLVINEALYQGSLAEWRNTGDLRLGQLGRTRDFPSLKYLECGRCYILRPSEICCLIESSPLIELVDLSDYYFSSEKVLEKIIAHVLARNDKVAFKVSCDDN